MSQSRNTATLPREERPLTGRSVVASVLLGMHPPELSGQRLVRTAALFGVSEGATRVALSRMVAAGELEADQGRYRLAGALLARQVRQEASRRPQVSGWDGSWRVVVVGSAVPRPAAQRAELRKLLTGAHMAEWRPGVWTRPDNLTAGHTTLAPDCTWMSARLQVPARDEELVERLWDLPAWSAGAVALQRRMAGSIGSLRGGRTEALAPCFLTAAAVVRHLQADPLLPSVLLPPRWPGAALRAEYDRYEAAYQALLRSWLRGITR